MRLFIAINLSEEAKEELKRIQKLIAKELGKFNLTNDYHLTLKFLGEVTPNIKDKLVENLKKIKFNDFDLSLNKISFFPDENHIRVVWVGLKNNKPLIELQSRIEEALKEFSFKKDFDFVPHLTLARVKFIENKRQFLDKLNNLKVKEIKFDVKDFRLIESILTKEGPVYRDLSVFGSS